MPLFEPVELAECQSLSFCNGNGVCARHLTSQDIFCHCHSNYTGMFCTTTSDAPPAIITDPVTDVYTWLWSFGFGILFFGSILFCSYMCTRAKGELTDSEADYHSSRDDLGGDFELLSPDNTEIEEVYMPKVRITIDVCD